MGGKGQEGHWRGVCIAGNDRFVDSGDSNWLPGLPRQEVTLSLSLLGF